MWGNPLQAVTNHFPQAEGPEVVFNLTKRDKGVETPPPNDSLALQKNAQRKC